MNSFFVCSFLRQSGTTYKCECKPLDFLKLPLISDGGKSLRIYQPAFEQKMSGLSIWHIYERISLTHTTLRCATADAFFFRFRVIFLSSPCRALFRFVLRWKWTGWARPYRASVMCIQSFFTIFLEKRALIHMLLFLSKSRHRCRNIRASQEILDEECLRALHATKCLLFF